MKHLLDTTLLQSLYKIDQISARKHTIQDLRLEIERALRRLYGDARVSVSIVMVSRAREESRSFERDFGALVARKKKTIIVNKGVDVYCKRYTMAPAHGSVRGVMGVPIFHCGALCAVITIVNKEKRRVFSAADASLVTLLAGRLASEVCYGRLNEKTSGLREENERLCLTDSLTNIPNRRFFDLIIDIELRKAKGYTRQVSLALVTPDQRRTGRGRNGSALLIHIAKTLKRNIRDTDFLARFGRNEFMVILPEALNEAAVNAAERVRKAVERTPFVVKGSKRKVTISVGVVTYPSSAENLVTLLEQAVKALNRAIQLGRNQVVSL